MSKPKHVGLLSMCERVANTDMERLAVLTAKAKGNRTNAAFADLCGVNAATMSRIMNAKFKKHLSDDVVATIAVNAADSNGSLFRELLDAHGLVIPAAKGLPVKEQNALYTEYLNQVRDAVELSRKTKADQAVIPPARKEAIQTRVQQIIQNHLINEGYRVARVKDTAVMDGKELPYFADFVLETNALEAEGLSRWAFVITENAGSSFIRDIDAITTEAYYGRPAANGYRISLITTDWQTFYNSRQTLRGYAKSYDSISIIYVNARYNLVEAEYVMQRDVETAKVLPAGKEDSEVDWQEIYGVPQE